MSRILIKHASMPNRTEKEQPTIQTSSVDQRSAFDGMPENLESTLASARPRLFRFALHQGVSLDAADDVVQETFLEAWRHLHRLHTPRGIDAWLTSICRHVCLRWARSQGVSAARQTSLSAATSEDQEPENLLERDIPDPLGFDPAEEVSRQELAGLLDRAMGVLPRSTREAIELCYLAELPQREAALRLGVTINALEVRLHRAPTTAPGAERRTARRCRGVWAGV